MKRPPLFGFVTRAARYGAPEAHLPRLEANALPHKRERLSAARARREQELRLAGRSRARAARRTMSAVRRVSYETALGRTTEGDLTKRASGATTFFARRARFALSM